MLTATIYINNNDVLAILNISARSTASKRSASDQQASQNAEANKNYSQKLQSYHKRYLDFLKEQFDHNYSKANWELKPASNYDLIKTVGAGAFATVFLARDKSTLQKYALKAVEKAVVIEKKALKQVYNEKKISLSIEFPFVVNCEEICKDNVYVYFVLPFVAGGELFTLIKKAGSLSEEIAKFYAAQLVMALEYLHHCKVIHRDVKPENMFIERNGYIKLGDFGLAKLVKNRTWTLLGTPEYIAPEIIMSKGYSFPVDWWALGILIYEMNVGNAPFYHSDPMKLYDKILIGRYKTPDNISAHCKTLIKHLLIVDSNKRYGSLKTGVYDIKNHAWFSDINWDALLHQKILAPYQPVIKDYGSGEGFTDIGECKLKICSFNQFADEFEDF